jgi:diacylglycerol kinase (CTP)
MRLRDRGDPRRRADAVRPHGLRVSASNGAVFVATDPASGSRPPSTLTPAELVRAAWHAFPGFLTVFLVVTAFPDERHRTWRAFPVANALAFPLAACWAVELWRLRRARIGASSGGDDARLARLADAFFANALRESERNRVHGTAWYLLGAWIALVVYPCDVAALSICALAFCDPAASVAGRAFRDARNNKRFANGKSAVGTLACFLVGAGVTFAMFRANAGVFDIKHDIEHEALTFSVLTFSAFVGGVVAGVEFFAADAYVNDNALIPVVVGAAAWPARGALLGWA